MRAGRGIVLGPPSSRQQEQHCTASQRGLPSSALVSGPCLPAPENAFRSSCDLPCPPVDHPDDSPRPEAASPLRPSTFPPKLSQPGRAANTRNERRSHPGIGANRRLSLLSASSLPASPGLADDLEPTANPVDHLTPLDELAIR